MRWGLLLAVMLGMLVLILAAEYVPGLVLWFRDLAMTS